MTLIFVFVWDMQSEFGEQTAKKDKAERGRIPFMVCNRARTQYFKAVFCQNPTRDGMWPSINNPL